MDPASPSAGTVAVDAARVLDLMGDAVIAAAADGRILYANYAVTQLLGWSPPELVGRGVNTLVPHRLREAPGDGSVGHVAGSVPHLLDRNVRLPALHRDGSEVSVELHLTAQGPPGAPELLVGSLRPVDAEVELERALTTALLADADARLGSSLDYDTTLVTLAELAIPTLADWCIIDVVEDDAPIRRLVVTHAGGARTERARALERYPPDPTGPHPAAEALRTGRARLLPQLDGATLRSLAVDGAHARLVSQLGFRSMIVVPVTTRSGVVGVLSLVAAESGRRYGPADLALAEELVVRAGPAVDNARLHRDLQASDRRLSALVHSVDAIVWEADADLRFTFVSRRAEESLGYPTPRWLDEPDFLWTLVHPDDRDVVIAQRRQALAEGGDVDLEFRVRAADGHIVWVRDIVSAIDSDGGHAVESPRSTRPGLPQPTLRGLMVNVTPRREAELAARRTGERFARLARTLQASLLPPHLPQVPGVDLDARYLPAGQGLEVGGDFYDVFALGRGGWALVMGDVCGKGAEAAAVTALARYTLRAAAMQSRRPHAILQILNRALLHQRDDGRFLTAVYGALRPAPGGMNLRVACGGHPLPLIIRADGRLEAVGVAGTALGLVEDVEVRDALTLLRAGDTVVLYTDGVLDARGDGEDFGEERLRVLLTGCAGLDATTVVERVVEAVVAWQPGHLRDDTAVLAVRVL